MSKKTKRHRSAESRPAPSSEAPTLTPKAKRRLAQEQRRRGRRQLWLRIAVAAGLVLAVGVVLALKFGGAPEAVSLAEALATSSPGAPIGPPGATELPAGTPEEQLAQLLAAGRPVFAFFHSNNCNQCLRMIAIVNQVYPEFAASVALVDVNVYDPRNERLLQRARIQFIPTQVFYDRSGRSQTTVGVMAPEQLRQQLQAISGGQ